MKWCTNAALATVLTVALAGPAVAQSAIMDAGELDPAAIARFHKKPGATH